MRQLREGQVGARKWFGCCSGPRVASDLAFSNLKDKWEVALQGGRYGTEAGLQFKRRVSF